jgi:SAM-dependent methyltransferase
MEIAELAWSPQHAGLREVEDGIWGPATAAHALSYPAEGNDVCFGLEETSFWFAHRNRCIVATVSRLPPAGPIVDVGAGNGFVSRALRDAGFAVVPVEPGAAGARHARDRGLRPVVCATLAEAGFAPGSVAAVGLFDVVEHMADDVAFLRGVRAAMRPGGRVYLTVPAFRWLWSADDDAAGHHRRYTRGSVAAALDAAGFRVAYSTYIFAWLPAPVYLFRSLPSRLGRRRESAQALGAGEHALPPNLAGRALAALLRAEERRVARGGALPFGGSCLVVATAR